MLRSSIQPNLSASPVIFAAPRPVSAAESVPNGLIGTAGIAAIISLVAVIWQALQTSP